MIYEPDNLYVPLSPDTMFNVRNPSLYRKMYADDWQGLAVVYGEKQIHIIADWLFKRLSRLSFGQWIVIEKDAIALSENLWIKGRYPQWNTSDAERIAQFKGIIYLLLELIWCESAVLMCHFDIVNEGGKVETRFVIDEPRNEATRELYKLFGHWPLTNPIIGNLLNNK